MIPRAAVRALLGLLLAGTLTTYTGCARTSTPRSPSGYGEGPHAAGGMSATSSQKPVTVAGSEGCKSLRVTPTVKVGDTWSALTLPCLTSAAEVRLGRLGGKPTLVNLWASWCGPCREEMPVLQAGHRKYSGNVQFVGIDTRDGAEPAAAFLREVGVTYPQLLDATGRLLARERIPGLPVTLLIDANGHVLDRHVGPLDASSLRSFIEPAISESPRQ